MPTWKFAPTSRGVIASTENLAWNIATNLRENLAMASHSDSSITYQGTVGFVFPSAFCVLQLSGTGLTYDLANNVTGGTLNQISMKIAGANYVTVTGLSISAETFDDLAIYDFDSSVQLEALMFKGNDIITGTGLDDNLKGSAGNDRLYGQAGMDELNGGTGADSLYGRGGWDDLTGGAGADKFIFDISVYASGSDSINDFAGNDFIVLDNDGFAGIGKAGKLNPALFKNIDTGTMDKNDRIFYSQTGGGLFYDPDGYLGLKPQVLFASLTEGTRLTAADIIVIN